MQASGDAWRIFRETSSSEFSDGLLPGMAMSPLNSRIQVCCSWQRRAYPATYGVALGFLGNCLLFRGIYFYRILGTISDWLRALPQNVGGSLVRSSLSSFQT